MLEFIVLGQIPGTTIFLTFSWILIITASVLTYFEFKLWAKRRGHASENRVATHPFIIFALEYLQNAYQLVNRKAPIILRALKDFARKFANPQ